jgi:hypothetical protein
MGGLVSKLLSLAEVFKAAISMPRSSSCASAGTASTNSRTETRRDDGRTRCLPRTQHDLALGAALYSGVREALESLRTPSRRLVARVKLRGRWVYLYRAVDARGQTVDFRLSPKRDVAAAKAFFRKAFKTQGRVPRTITLDGYQASHRARAIGRGFPSVYPPCKKSTFCTPDRIFDLFEGMGTFSRQRARP